MNEAFHPAASVVWLPHCV